MTATGQRGWQMLAAALSVASILSVVLGHGEGPPTPPEAPVAWEADHIYPVRWSWVHWWEANRDPYLEIIRQGRGQKPDQAAIAKYRKQAVEALAEALKSDLWQLRASAALSLGQMGEQAAMEGLIELVKTDKNPGVAIVSLLAIGLLDSPKGESFLTSYNFPNGPQREGGICALGLMTQVSPAGAAGLQKTADGGNGPSAAVSAWALGRHGDPANAKFLKGALGRTVSPWVASEAILSLGSQGDADSARVLSEILLETPAGKSFAAWKELDARFTKLELLQAAIRQRRLEYPAAYDDYVKAYKAWTAKNSPNAPPPEASQEGKDAPAQITYGLELIYEVRLQASAAIALGNIDTPISRQALLRCLDAHDNGYSQLYKGFAIMSLGRLGEPAAVPVLADMLAVMNKTGARKSSEKLKSPLRGYAALALGLYARPYKTPQGPADRPGFDKVSMLLAERMADAGEEMEVRSAAEVALGLTGRTENLKLLQAATGAIGIKDDPLIGYVILARGMLGDRNVLEGAKKYLAVANDNQTTAGVLGRRAAVLGLALMGTQETIPILIEAWGLSYHSNREVTLALSLCGAYNVTEELVKLMTTAENPWERAFAARCLGELFNKSRPQRLACLINGSNYTFKNNRLAPYRALANEFLFLHLLPAFGETWR